ncbi:MAG: biopolymer transporter ExbD [Myxococcales bacterium]|nr:biopolymer transporter ExbD [Myxococcales bacterium]
MARKKTHPDEKVEDLNLVPIMNLVVCLIPIVLLGTSLVKIGVVNVNPPKFGVADTPPDDTTEKPLDLTVAVGEDGFRVSAAGADLRQVLGLAPTTEATATPLIAKQGEHYDYVALYNMLVQLKGAFPHESVLKLTGDARIPFKVMLATMDAVRVRLEQDRYDDLEDFRTASVQYAGNTPDLLWPDVVFAVAE